MKRLAVALVVAGTGCDRVFQLGEVTDLGGSDSTTMSGCWDPTREPHDEDGDGVQDGCDLCPADGALSTDVDLDVDSVADVCDPDVAAPSVVVDFDGFMTQRPWQDTSGTWSVASGAIGVTTGGTTALTELTIPVAEHPRVDAIFDTPTGVGVFMKVGAAQTNVVCRHEKRSGTDMLVMQIGGGQLIETPLDNGLDNGRIRLGIDATGIPYCHAVRGGVTASLTAPMIADVSTTRIGLIGVDTRFLSVTVFGKQ